MQTQPVEVFFWVIIVIGGIGAYLLPTILAVWLDHERAGLITFLNVALGWTGVGWLALLLWSINTEYLLGLMTKPRSA